MSEAPNGNILIVDDEPPIRELLETVINRAGFQSASVATGEEALGFLRSSPVSVVITDIRLPGMDGLDLVTRIKSDFQSDVIVVTGDGDHHSYEEAINKGASDFILKPIRNEELVLRVRRVLEERDLRHSRARMLRDLEQLVITDGLTQLYNSRHFHNQLEIEVGRASRYKHRLSLLLLDIDHFKAYNDTYGHLRGDEVLVRIGQLVRQCLRTTDSAYRYGGEEFTVILPETSLEQAGVVAERIRTTVADGQFAPGTAKAAKVTVSVGVTEYGRDESSAAFVQRADQAMYRSKEQGRNSVTALKPGSV